MRFSKKLLTVLLPITAASTLVPVLTSCNKGNAWDFEYGSLVNCLKTSPESTEASYHTLADVQSAVKNHVAVEATSTVTSVDELPQWDDTTPAALNNQILYFDFIASATIMGNRKFNLLQWSVSETRAIGSIKIDIQDGFKEHTTEVPATHVAYLADSTNPKQIDIAIYTNVAAPSSIATFKSYMFQNTTIGE